jgi:hypothetical protein
MLFINKRKKYMIVSVRLGLSYENIDTSSRINMVKYVAEQINQSTERIMKLNVPNGFIRVHANSTFLHVIGKRAITC